MFLDLFMCRARATAIYIYIYIYIYMYLCLGCMSKELKGGDMQNSWRSTFIWNRIIMQIT